MSGSDTQPIYRWTRLLGGIVGRQQAIDLEEQIPQLLPSRYYHGVLEREILRSDRTQSPLSVLVLDVRRKGNFSQNLWAKRMKQLARIVLDVSRRVDAKGWYRDERGLRISLVLSDTEPQKTSRLINLIRTKFIETANNDNGHSGMGNDISCEIFAYPDERYWDSRDGSDQGQDNGNGSNGDGSKGNGNKSMQHEGGRHEYRAELANAYSGGDFAAAPTEALIAKPMPFWKRMLDVVVASLMLLLLSPLLFAVALIIKLSSKGPVIFKQDRVGFQHEDFQFYKFRSMRINNNKEKKTHAKYLSDLIKNGEEKSMEKLDNQNPDITLIGKIIRCTYIDEMPQLINVLKGEMSLVGPRPCLRNEVGEYLQWNCRRFDVYPGMTGLWQVSGKNRLTFKQMIRYDITYCRNHCLLMDIKIMLLTVPHIVTEVRSALHRKRQRSAC